MRRKYNQCAVFVHMILPALHLRPLVNPLALLQLPQLYDFYILKHRDVPKLVYSGVLDVGITTTEWIKELNLPLYKIKELSWYSGRLSLLSRQKKLLKSKKNIRCITEFPNIARKFFISEKVNSYSIECISGSTEGLIPTLYDCSIDCVETGLTKKLHLLEEEKVLFQSKAVLIIKNRKKLDKLDSIISKLKLD